MIIATDFPSGECPAMDYLAQAPEQEQLDILGLIGRLAEHGPMVNPERFKRLTPTDIHEIKSHQHRVFCFFGHREADGRGTLVLANAYRKKEWRTEPQQIQRALRLRDRYFEGGQK